jgi:hypothetical protein
MLQTPNVETIVHALTGVFLTENAIIPLGDRARSILLLLVSTHVPSWAHNDCPVPLSLPVQTVLLVSPFLTSPSRALERARPPRFPADAPSPRSPALQASVLRPLLPPIRPLPGVAAAQSTPPRVPLSPTTGKDRLFEGADLARGGLLPPAVVGQC